MKRTKKIFLPVLRMTLNPHNIIQIIREADIFTSSLFTITYYLIDKFRKKRVKSEE